MDRISHKYTSRPFPGCGPDRLCFVVEVEAASRYTFGFVHNPGTSN